MNIEQFTVKTQEVLQRAQNITLAHQQQQIENAHLLKAMLEEDKDVLSFLLKKNGVNVNQVRQVTDKMVESIKAIHAGLECGLLGGVYPNWDMISFGPTIMHPHSPDEKVNVESVDRFWKFLVETLANIPVK